MTTKSSSPGPNASPAPTPKAARSRKAATQKQDVAVNAGRAGSAGGILLEREKESKAKILPIPSKTAATPLGSDAATEGTASAATKTRRKPRKLNKDSVSAKTNVGPPTAVASPEKTINELGAAAELEALKSRVRGLEAKVEGLYRSEQSNRSPRRRGKGRKGSSTQQVPTLSTVTKPISRAEETNSIAADDEQEEADEELVRLEDELESARQDLARYRPQTRRSRSSQTNQPDADDGDVEEIPRDSPATVDSPSTTRQVTLSGSYRIPLPASVNTEDLKAIQSGVSAAQNVARSFLEQRRAVAASREQQNTRKPSASASIQPKRPRPAKSTSSTMEVVKVGEDGEKQSWGEWFGGYSVAISRAVKHIEHEAAVESQKVDAKAKASSSGTANTGTKKGTQPGAKVAGKRPPAKAKLSSEQVHGLMS